MTRASVVSRIVHDAYAREPELLGDGVWWERLDLDFARRREPFRLSLRDRLRVGATAASDLVLRTLGACLVGTLALPPGYHPLAIRRALGELDFYCRLAEGGDPDRFFAPPPTSRLVLDRRPARFPLFHPKLGVCEDLRFESPFVPVNPAQRVPYLRQARNRIAHARYWRHASRPRPTVLALHGFSADLYHLNEWFFAIPWLYREGYDVMLVTLPFHGRRQSHLSPFSGHGFFAGGAARINEALAQSVFDVRLLFEHLLASGAPAVGVMGVSLGGLTSALLASVEPRLAFALPNVPVVSIADLVLQWEPIGSLLRLALKASGRDVRDARRLLAPSSPLSYKPRIPRERLMIVGGVGDRLAPPKHSRLLWDHWGRCRIHWFPGSHLIHLDRGEYLAQMRRFFGEIGFRVRVTR